MKKHLGTFGVDSGQVMLVDPCYLSDFKNDDFKDERVYKRVGNYSDETPKRKILEFHKDFTSYEQVIPEWDMTMNELVSKGIYEKIEPVVDNSFSYNGACNQTCYNKEHGGQLKAQNGYDIAVVSSTGYGDGGYDVYATYEDGFVKKLEVVFF
tara:strand:+ start:402 stop:860 length:459 start_codon:yes stop_codon:yes gene_type:complete